MSTISKNKKGFNEVVVEFDLGGERKGVELYQYLSEKYGAPVIDSWIISKGAVVVQSKVSNILGNDPSVAPSQEQVQAILDKWVPGVVERAPSVKKEEVAKNFLQKMKSTMGAAEFKQYLKEQMGI